jgi:hypothetical protein
LIQRKLDRVRRFFGVATEQEAIDLALASFTEEMEIRRTIVGLRGIAFDPK